MPEKRTLARAAADRRAGKAPSTQAGEFVREEIEHIRAGKHGARSTRQAIAIGLAKARRAGVKLPPPGASASPATRAQAARDRQAGEHPQSPVSARRSRATRNALDREPRAAASRQALAAQARAAAKRRSPAARAKSARQAARTRRGSRAAG